jgi:hypothetical protein
MRIPLATCVSYVESKIETVPVPDWTHLDVISKGTIILDFSQVYIDDDDGNVTKVETHTAEEIETLKNSFAEGVDLKEFPPAVRFRGYNYDKPYVLVYGYGRGESLQELQQKRWFFTLLEGNDDSIGDVQAQENEGALPKRINKEVDMRLFLNSKVKDGVIKNTPDAIIAKFKKVYPNRDKSVMNRIVQQVMEQANTPQPYKIFTSTARIQQWFDNHSSEKYCIEGEYDVDRDMYGVHIKEGYQYRVVIAAIERYSKTGKFTYVIGHFAAPTGKATLHSKRIKFQQEFDRIKIALESCGLTIWPIVIMGYFPQDKENDNMKELVKLVVLPKAPTVFDPNLLDPLNIDIERMVN